MTPVRFIQTNQLNGGKLMMRSFTLIEMLAVIAILSLAAAALTPSLFSRSQSADLLQFAARLRDIDSRARIAARASGSAVIVKMAADQHELQMVQRNSGEILARLEVDRGIALSIEVNGHQSPILFDRLGRSEDYTIDARLRLSTMRWKIAGGTGFTQRQEMST